jgi:hypothetical protein
VTEEEINWFTQDMVAWMFVWEMLMHSGVTSFIFKQLHIVFVVWINKQEMQLYIMWV